LSDDELPAGHGALGNLGNQWTVIAALDRRRFQSRVACRVIGFDAGHLAMLPVADELCRSLAGLESPP